MTNRLELFPSIRRSVSASRVFLGRESLRQSSRNVTRRVIRSLCWLRTMTGRQRKSRKPSGTKAESLLKSSTFFVNRCLGNGVGFALQNAGLIVEFHKDHF